MGLDSAGVVRLSPLSTKKIKGLHENDFIMASKIDRLLDRPDGFLDHKQ
jgi:4a-hydroxytetrahydrobiopterin dehydratase